MAARLNNDNSAMAEINVIPLVDIILVVLIIFMVAAPLVMKPKIDINLPKASTAKEENEKKALKVVLGKNGEVFVNDKPVTMDGLTTESKSELARNPLATVLLIADKASTLEMVTEIVDAIKQGGISKVAFSVQKK